eukprot:COSAG05_NODE_14135_length_406_cov_1.657980_1_plen_52_part_01
MLSPGRERISGYYQRLSSQITTEMLGYTGILNDNNHIKLRNTQITNMILIIY